MTWWLTSGESEWWAYLRDVSDQEAVRGPSPDRVYRRVTAQGRGERPFSLVLSPRHGGSFDTFGGDDRMEVQVWRLDKDHSSAQDCSDCRWPPRDGRRCVVSDPRPNAWDRGRMSVDVASRAPRGGRR